MIDTIRGSGHTTGEELTMTRTSRAVVFLGGGKWEIRELPVPDEPPAGGAILRVEATGMCHSDIDNLNGIVHTPWGGEFPTIPGHEVVGRIEQLGAGAAEALGVAEGDRVAVRSGRFGEDNRTRIYGHDYSVEEGCGLYGGYADYMELLPGSSVVRLPEDPPGAEMTIWEPLSIAAGWAGVVREGDAVAVLGPGHLGLAALVAARANGAGKIMVTGTPSDGFRLEAAKRLGADLAVDIGVDDPIVKATDLTDGNGVDVVIDAASGSTSTVVQAMQMVRRGGIVVIGGLKDRKPVEGFISDWIPMRRIHILAGSDGDHVQTAVDLLWAGRVPTTDLIGEVFSLEQVGEALDILDRKTPGRDAIRVGLSLM
jgi:threonine dehydrogenase-like Zn-dependent dehydrogenase